MGNLFGSLDYFSYICRVNLNYKFELVMKLNYEEFYDYVWNEYISERVVPNRFLNDNRELIESITYDVYHVYKQQSNVSEREFAKILEQTFNNIIRIGVLIGRDNSINDAYESFD